MITCNLLGFPGSWKRLNRLESRRLGPQTLECEFRRAGPNRATWPSLLARHPYHIGALNQARDVGRPCANFFFAAAGRRVTDEEYDGEQLVVGGEIIFMHLRVLCEKSLIEHTSVHENDFTAHA